MKLGLALTSPINFQAFANVEPIVGIWMILMLILIITLPFIWLRDLWRRWKRARCRRQAARSLLE